MRRSSTLTLVLSFAFFSGAALAEPTAADRATARTLAQEGQQALESKNYAIAIDKFGRADSLVHAPTLLLGLARAQVGLGDWSKRKRASTASFATGSPPARRIRGRRRSKTRPKK